MIFLIILCVILFIIAAVLFLPVSVFVDFKEDFLIEIFFSGIKVYEMKPKEKNTHEQAQKSEIKQKNPPSLFQKFREKYGFSGAVKEFFGFFKQVLSNTKQFLRHIKIKRLKLFISIATDDAAKTAIEYGTVCAAAYPVLSALDGISGIRYKKIDIKSDFESKTPQFSFSFYITLQIFFLLIALFKIYKDYKKFIARIESDERK